MFSLIITIISIALVAALAVATLYFGGSAFTEGTTQANASGVINQAQQIGGASTLYTVRNAGDHPEDVEILATEDYLSSIPALAANIGGSWAMGDEGFVSNVILSEAVCGAINVEAGDPNGDGTVSGDFDSTAGSMDLGGMPYGCDWDGGEDEGAFLYGY
ncbi:hypothetical protein [Thioalkalivibrio sp. ALE16]|uniref:hypothetical protein n=1 Tax=Thioalkalivibrio sp. ALE16 TaxID=1158172 RepID=UPI00037F0F16|nr:hypothetical protein [Thioalkalivibrio sp. ALE16]